MVDLGLCPGDKPKKKESSSKSVIEGVSQLNIFGLEASDSYRQKRFFYKSLKPNLGQKRRLRANRDLSDSTIRGLVSRIHQDIWQTFMAMAEVVILDSFLWIRLGESSVQNQLFCQAVRQALNIPAEEPMETAFRRLKTDLADIEVCVRASIGAAVCFGAFHSTFPNYLTGGTWAAQNVEDTLMNICESGGEECLLAVFI